jgi:hypothetical protein
MNATVAESPAREEVSPVRRCSGAVPADETGPGRGITKGPFGVVDGKYGVSGAQPLETFTAALRQAWGSS